MHDCFKDDEMEILQEWELEESLHREELKTHNNASSISTGKGLIRIVDPGLTRTRRNIFTLAAEMNTRIKTTLIPFRKGMKQTMADKLQDMEVSLTTKLD
jgi:hypothetical protein